MALRLPLFSSKTALLLNRVVRQTMNNAILLAFCFACQPALEPSTSILGSQDRSSEAATYVLLLADTTRFPISSQTTYRSRWPAAVKLVVSGYGNESPKAILERLPWLLQPGVDTLYVIQSDPAYLLICDSVAKWSPSTYCGLLSLE